MADKYIRRGGDEYGSALFDCLPFGQAWPRTEEGVLYKVVYGLAKIWGDVDGKAGDLLQIESDPTKTTEMLTDWERNFGLPDFCFPIPPTDEDIRRTLLVKKMTLLGAQDRQFYIDQADDVGQAVSISEHAPYMCGVSRCGDSRMPSLTDDVDHYRWELGRPEIRFYWEVKLLALHPDYVGVDIFCLLRRWKPAHTEVLFDFSSFNDGDFSNAWYSGNVALF